jgi:ATP-dependent Zn protease
MLPDEDRGDSKKQLMAKIAVSMAGRAAEELIYGPDEVTAGASQDFQNATNIAYRMVPKYLFMIKSQVTKWGMSDKVGKIFLEKGKMSPEQAKIVDEEVTRILDVSETVVLI